MFAHFARQMCQNFMLIVQLYSKHSPGQHRRDGAYQFYGLFAGQVMCSGLLRGILPARHFETTLPRSKTKPSGKPFGFWQLLKRKHLLFFPHSPPASSPPPPPPLRISSSSIFSSPPPKVVRGGFVKRPATTADTPVF